MLSDEEKQAMQYFYNLRATIDESNMLFDEDINVKCGKETIEQITIVLNLIEKQSKEIEELKKYEKYYEEMEEVNKKFIAVDKIKEKIKEYYEYDKRMQNKPDWHTTKYYEAKALEKLLEE